MNNVEYFFLSAALNPIRSLIRVIHRDFTLQVDFFWFLFREWDEAKVGIELEN